VPVPDIFPKTAYVACFVLAHIYWSIQWITVPNRTLAISLGSNSPQKHKAAKTMYRQYLEPAKRHRHAADDDHHFAVGKGKASPSIVENSWPMEKPANQGVTVVVATLNRTPYLLDCLKDLLAQTHRPLEILVVDQSGNDGGDAYIFARAHADVIRYDLVPFTGLPLARNYGWQKARYDAVLFVDDDTRCPPNLVEEHVRALSNSGVGVVAGAVNQPGAIEMKGPTGTFNHWTARITSGFAADFEGDVDHGRGCNLCVWRPAVIAVGGWDEGLTPAAAMYEDLELCLRVKRAGYRVYFAGKARNTHLCAPLGGCRVKDFRVFLWGMARNRTIVIRRNLKWYQRLYAFTRQFIQIGSLAIRQHHPRLVAAGLSGWASGYFRVPRKVHCTHFPADTLAAGTVASAASREATSTKMRTVPSQCLPRS
jgi:GT2 family glycosyltransferase